MTLDLESIPPKTLLAAAVPSWRTEFKVPNALAGPTAINNALINPEKAPEVADDLGDISTLLNPEIVQEIKDNSI